MFRIAGYREPQQVADLHNLVQENGATMQRNARKYEHPGSLVQVRSFPSIAVIKNYFCTGHRTTKTADRAFRNGRSELAALPPVPASRHRGTHFGTQSWRWREAETTRLVRARMLARGRLVNRLHRYMSVGL